MTYLPRSAWNARPRRHAPGTLDAADVRGIAVHWPAHERPIPKDAIAGALRSWQDDHMDGQGWSDIAYQVAVDQWGRKWRLRGLTSRPAANGSTTTNGRYGAVLLIVAQGERPSAALLRATREVVADFRELYPGANDVAGHGDVRKRYGLGWTECPGLFIREAIKAGEISPAGREESMKASDVWGFKIGPKGDRRPARLRLFQAWWNAREARIAARAAHRQARQNADAIAELATGLDELAPGISRRVIEALGERVELELAIDLEDEDAAKPEAGA